jgi:hypothetical protein
LARSNACLAYPAAVLLRTMAWLDMPTKRHLLALVNPRQLELDLSEEN